MSSMGQIKIIKPGLLTTVQDLGRYGYQQYGVTVSGVMDNISARLANILVGNDEGEGLLEITMLGPEIEFLEAMVIAITGGDLFPILNNNAVAMGKSLLVKKGDKLAFKGIKNGCRSYIAFSGGIEVPIIMGSKSTFTRGNIGGYEGRALKAGDTLPIGNHKVSLSSLVGNEIYENLYEYKNNIELRILLGPQEHAFTEKGLQTFLTNEYSVTNECDRMGYRLQGEKIEHEDGGDIISDGIAMGAIQVPSHGNPIIMMADRQTTGGYTKIGNIITVDLPKVAQAKAGDKIAFKEVTIEEAHHWLKELEGKIDSLKQQCRTKQKEVIKTREFHIKVNGKPYEVMVEELKS